MVTKVERTVRCQMQQPHVAAAAAVAFCILASFGRVAIGAAAPEPQQQNSDSGGGGVSRPTVPPIPYADLVENLLNVTTEAPSPFMKYGDSYGGQTAARVLGQSLAEVAVGVTLDNWSRWALIEPDVEMDCGRQVADRQMPEVVRPGYSEFAMFEKKPGLTGVCGVLSYKVELDSEEDAEYLQVMFSVPYNLNNYDSYLAVGVSGEYLNSSDGGLFRTFYYYSGSFERAQAGRMAEYQSEHITIRGNMKPDTYKPTLSVQVLPRSKDDQFVPGEAYAPRTGKSRAAAENAASFPLVLIILSVAAATQRRFSSALSLPLP